MFSIRQLLMHWSFVAVECEKINMSDLCLLDGKSAKYKWAERACCNWLTNDLRAGSSRLTFPPTHLSEWKFSSRKFCNFTAGLAVYRL